MSENGIFQDLRERYHPGWVAHGLAAGHGGEGSGYSTAAFYFSNIEGRPVISVALVNRDQLDLGLEIAFALADLFGH